MCKDILAADIQTAVAAAPDRADPHPTIVSLVNLCPEALLGRWGVPDKEGVAMLPPALIVRVAEAAPVDQARTAFDATHTANAGIHADDFQRAMLVMSAAP